jgi:hypothetical protein
MTNFISSYMIMLQKIKFLVVSSFAFASNEAVAPGNARREVGLAQAAMYQRGGEGG